MHNFVFRWLLATWLFSIDLIIGGIATRDVDYVTENTTIRTILTDQDVVEVCQPVQISADILIERTEYFKASLYRSGVFVATCQVAIRDGNGGMCVSLFVWCVQLKFACIQVPLNATSQMSLRLVSQLIWSEMTRRKFIH